MRRRDFIVASFAGITVLTRNTFAANAANQPSAFYFDNPWHEGETSVLGDIGWLFAHEGLVYCQPGEFLELGAGLYQKPFAEAKKRLEAKEHLSMSNKVISVDPQGQLIVTAVMDDNAKWLIQRDRELDKQVRKKYWKDDHDQFSTFMVEHAVGIQGKKYLAIDPTKLEIELATGLGEKKKVTAHRVILTDKPADRQFVWYNDYSGK